MLRIERLRTTHVNFIGRRTSLKEMLKSGRTTCFTFGIVFTMRFVDGASGALVNDSHAGELVPVMVTLA